MTKHLKKRTPGETLWLRTPTGLIAITVESMGTRVVTMAIEAYGDVEVLHGQPATPWRDPEPVLTFAGEIG